MARNFLPDLEHLSKENSAALDRHAANIRTFVGGQRVGAAHMFGYAYLAGRELLLVRDLLPHGNTGDRGSGLKRFIEERLKLSSATGFRWMEYAQCIQESKAAASLFEERPLLLSKGKLTVRDRATILDLVPLVMDGKSMREFMRGTKLLRDPEKPAASPRRKLSAEAARAAKQKQAERLWSTVLSDQQLGHGLLRFLDASMWQQILDRNVATNDVCRQLLKAK